MSRNRAITILMGLAITLAPAIGVRAQEDSSQQTPTDEQRQNEKAATEKKALTMLDQIVDEAQALKLPENRIRIQAAAGDLLWERNQARARTLFSQAAEGISEMMRNAQLNDRRGANQLRWAAELRQELVLAVAQHDAPLAYQLLAATRQPTPSPEVARNPRRGGFSEFSEDNLEQALLARVAALDPKLAFENADQSLDKGKYPVTLPSVLAQLQTKDKDAAAKLSDHMLKRLKSDTLLSNSDAGNLALGLLQPGPRPVENSTGDAPTAPPANPAQVLSQGPYSDLMDAAIEAALKATPLPPNQRGPGNFRGRGNPGGFGGSDNSPAQLSDEQIQQSNARRLLSGLQGMLSQIDQNLPARAQSVRQKIAEVGLSNAPRVMFSQLSDLMEDGTSDKLLAAAPSAPPPLQARIYQQAALKALDEGNPDRARQIANDHLDTATRESVLQALEFQEISQKADATKMDELRQTLSRLRSDDERINLLLQLSAATQKNNQKLSLQLLDEACRYLTQRAGNYQQFEQQLKVARAYAAGEPSRSFEVLEPGIMQLNELLSAAASLSGFEVNIFKEGELPMQGGSNLGNMVTRYGEEIGGLAKIDFERAQTLANRFQFAEPRILVRLSIVRSLLGAQATRSTDE